LLAAKSIGPNGHVFSFEPLQSVRQHLAENIALNRLTNCTIRAEAAFNVDGECDFFAGPADHLGTSSLRQLGNASDVIRIRTARADAILPADLHVAMVKIDVEGAEYQAIEGLQGILDRCRPDLIVEVTPEYLERMGSTAQQLYDHLSGMGYRAYVIENHGLAPVSKLAVERFVQANVLFSCRRDFPLRLLRKEA
jgi:FkbM family methyltransferase